MASIAWIIFGTILIINSVTSIVQNYGGNRKCHCVNVGNICNSNSQLFWNHFNPYSQDFCEENEVQYCSIPDGPISETCGIKKMTVMSQKTIGQAQVGEYPWQAAILMRNEDGGYTYKGAGVLINKKHVLTVAHIIETCDVIRLGEWDLSSNEEPCSQQDYQATKIIKHPWSSSTSIENNIAMIILDRDVPLAASPHINTACLPSSTPLFGRCWVAGWDCRQELIPGTTKRLRDIKIPIVNRDACQQSIQNIIDNGAPLVCESSPGKMEVVGLVTRSTGCQANVPSLFVDVSKFTSWIHQQVYENF
ncbi:phenoloxidase-activating factor 2-like [Cotesia glomerata]|uniref:phenoloxidase-activating factor 2-like n=1 Tax=Cotesia glomerata TaxID=32391 RepID=UPI001D024D9B|nr:phenoloxidase-activating factor 2-like [Cotesia glomerata]